MLTGIGRIAELVGNSHRADGLTLRVIGIGLGAKRNVGDIAFGIEGKHAQQTGGLAHAHHHDTGCHGVKRTGMANAPLMEGASALRNHVMGRAAHRLIDGE